MKGLTAVINYTKKAIFFASMYLLIGLFVVAKITREVMNFHDIFVNDTDRRLGFGVILSLLSLTVTLRRCLAQSCTTLDPTCRLGWVGSETLQQRSGPVRPEAKI